MVDTKPVPVTVITDPVPPTSSTEGDTEAMVGEGLLTTRLVGVPDALVTVPLDTTTVNCAPVANCVAGSVAVSSVPLT